jgi:hypothetical protein
VAIGICPVETHFDVPPMSFLGSLPPALLWKSRVFRYVLMLRNHDTMMPATNAGAASHQPLRRWTQV